MQSEALWSVPHCSGLEAFFCFWFILQSQSVKLSSELPGTATGQLRGPTFPVLLTVPESMDCAPGHGNIRDFPPA